MKFTAKKGQMEMLGLAVIVILLALGIFFITQFTFTETKSDLVQNVQQKEFVSNFLHTLLLSEAGCEKSTARFSDLIDELESPENSYLVCGGYSKEGLVTYLNETVSGLLEETLGTWKKYSYDFSIKFPSSATISGTIGQNTMTITDGCIGYNKESSFYIVKGDVEDIYVSLTICY